MEYSDKEVLSLINNGEDDRALSFLYKKLLPKIRHLVKNNSGDDEEAYDIFQDAILIFYKHVKNGKFNTQYEIGGFIYSISRNLWINRAKQKNRTTALTPGDSEVEDNNILDDLITKEREDHVMKMLSSIGEKCRELLLYSIFHKFSMKEICQKMGLSTENAAKTQNYKCKQKLVELVKDNSYLKDLLQ